MRITCASIIVLFASTQVGSAFTLPSFGSATTTTTTATTKKPVAAKTKKSKKTVAIKSKEATSSPLKIDLPKLGDFKAPEVPSLPDVSIPSPVGAAGVAMSAAKPLFALEARAQAGVLTFVGDVVGVPFRVNPEEIRRDIKKRISTAKPVLYTYGLSPFSAEAKKIVEDYDVEIVQLGAEWFLLGAAGSETRLALAENSSDAQTSLPHLFVKGESLGGLSTGGRNGKGINGLVRSGEIDKILKKRK